VAVIVEHGMRVMLEEQEDVFFYLTLMNESYAHEHMPDCAVEGIVKGMHQIRHTSCSLGESERVQGLSETTPQSSAVSRPRVQLLGSGTILREVIAAGEILARDYKIESDVWSVTSFSELRRDGLSAERANRFGISQSKQLSWVETSLNGGTGPVIAASDYVRAVPDLIRTWIPRRYITLGTDGFGRSDTRESLRKFFEVDRLSIAFAAIAALIDEGSIPRETREDFLERYSFALPTASPWER
jgi:pyruvate dehydrogenase E1 component